MREWKPGDVAASTLGTVLMTEFGWCYDDGSGPEYDDLSEQSPPPGLRPLVTIDPEDREQVERLVAELESLSFSVWGCGAVSAMQAALCEFANPKPPKPEEPTGLGAVVEDSDGNLWVRGADPHYSWVRAHRDEGAHTMRSNWESIDTARVLSEGVQP